MNTLLVRMSKHTKISILSFKDKHNNLSSYRKKPT